MRALIALTAAVPLCACSMMEDDVARTHDRAASFTVPSAYMTADARIVTQRRHPVTGQPVVCVEPSPDAMRAVSTSAKGDLSGGNGAVTAAIGLSGASAETAAELAGRTTALLGLREGLFRACEAYANGTIGSSAYSLVLAKYGQTMTTLFLAQDIAGAAGAEGKALATSAMLAGGSDAASKPSGDTQKKPAPSQASFLPGQTTPRLWPAVSLGGTPPARKPKTKAGSAPDTASKPTDAVQSAGVSATAALALVRMNEDYMMQPQGLITTLVTACIEENDPTRQRMARDRNTYLDGLCDQLQSLDAIARYQQTYAKLAEALPLVDPATSGPTSRHR